MVRPGAATFGIDFDPDSLTRLHWLALGLTILTGANHVYMFITGNGLFALILGVGFYFGAALFVFDLSRRQRSIDPSRRYRYAAGVLYTPANIVWYYASGTQLVFTDTGIEGYFEYPIHPSWLGLVDKLVQAILVIVLLYLYRRAATRGASLERHRSGNATENR
jgi:hypothetical protein